MAQQQSPLALRSLEEVPDPAPGRRFVLKNLYNFLNREIFDGALPSKMEVRWESSLHTSFGKSSPAGPIRLSHTLLYKHPSRDFLIDVLLHEMIRQRQHQFAPQEKGNGPYFMAEMERINTAFGRRVAVTFSSPYSLRQLDKVCKHRWKCTSCAFVVKKSRAIPPGAEKRREHSDTGCSGELVKMTPNTVAGDIAAYCAASLAAEEQLQ
ncbi:uncharacterized protein LOC117651210 [Thrips palmi]|uniref:Uncharacterized protein LOC117651210 n=1 Tax=Thrips palmi TaxID=161013 RepID=A0A6P9A0T0_THRPL|nr:uncharacterized protein LOC117651210 [Thrips palmi]